MGNQKVDKKNRKQLDDLKEVHEWVAGWTIADAADFLQIMKMVRHSDEVTDSGRLNLKNLRRLELLVLEIVRSNSKGAMDQFIKEANSPQAGVTMALVLLGNCLCSNFFRTFHKPIEIDYAAETASMTWVLTLSTTLTLLTKPDRFYGTRETHLFYDSAETAVQH